jgi:hypothetical protein
MSEEFTLTAKKRFPKATVTALWEAVELLQPALLCCRPYGNGTVDCADAPSDWQQRGQARCRACRAKKLLEISHHFVEHMELPQTPLSGERSVSEMTPRELLIRTIQHFANDWKMGSGADINSSKSQLCRVLDAYEFSVEDKYRKKAKPKRWKPFR